MWLLAQQSYDTTVSPESSPTMRESFTAWYDAYWPYVNNTLVLMVVAMALLAVLGIRRSQFWRESTKRVFSLWRARLSFMLLLAMVLIGLLDSVAWRDPIIGDDGKPLMRDGMITWDVGRSLLDRIDAATLNLSGREVGNEKTYSAPFASTLFTKESFRNEEGKMVRDYPKLIRPGAHPLGTDQVGDDVLYKSIKSVRTGLIIGGMTTLIAIPFAILLGMTAGYYGKWYDDAVMYIYSVLTSIPRILLIIAFVLSFGNGLFQLCIIMGVTTSIYLGRLIRGEVIKLREMDYVQAARAVGLGSIRIQVRHILPNVFHLVVIRAVLLFSGLVLAEAVLSYLNVGVGSNTYSWGRMINEGRLELSRDPVIWWNLLAAFIFMFALVLPANVFGDAVRDALDPRLKDVK